MLSLKQTHFFEEYIIKLYYNDFYSYLESTGLSFILCMQPIKSNCDYYTDTEDDKYPYNSHRHFRCQWFKKYTATQDSGFFTLVYQWFQQ